jgi:hypothetical protein
MKDYSKSIAKPFVDSKLLNLQPTARRFIYTVLRNETIYFNDYFIHMSSGAIKKLCSKVYKSETNEWLLNGKYKETDCHKLSILFLTK